MKTIQNILGQKFGRLTVTKFSHKGKYGGYWECQCDCGNIRINPLYTLKRGHTTSCGCYGQNVARKYVLDEDFFENIDTEEKAYWLGFIYADGNIHKNRKQFTLGIHKGDIKHLEKLKNNIGSSHPIRITNKNLSYLTIKNKRFCSHLINLGVVPRKSLIAKPPSIIKSLQKHFWRGCIDGDGNLFFYNRRKVGIGFVGAKDMVNGFLDFVAQNKIKTNAKPHKHSLSEVYTYCVEGANIAYDLAKVLYENSNMYLDRKMAIAERIMEEV